jgi:hypothetical protein
MLAEGEGKVVGGAVGEVGGAVLATGDPQPPSMSNDATAAMTVAAVRPMPLTPCIVSARPPGRPTELDCSDAVGA